jgi:hypothetical protein
MGDNDSDIVFEYRIATFAINEVDMMARWMTEMGKDGYSHRDIIQHPSGMIIVVMEHAKSVPQGLKFV